MCMHAKNLQDSKRDDFVYTKTLAAKLVNKYTYKNKINKAKFN